MPTTMRSIDTISMSACRYNNHVIMKVPSDDLIEIKTVKGIITVPKKKWQIVACKDAGLFNNVIEACEFIDNNPLLLKGKLSIPIFNN